MITPKALNTGDKVGLVAPSGPLTQERRASCLDTVNKLGLKAVAGKSFYENDDFLAGSDEIRAKDINKFFADDTIKGIFCVRGGYGSQRIISMLDGEMIRNNAKIFLGYSDITALHSYFNNLGLATYHGPMVGADFFSGIDDESVKSFKERIFSKEGSLQYTVEKIVSGKCKGLLCGGNLTVLVSSIGTQYEPDFKEKIVFLEDVGEEPYKVDRMLNHLKQCGKLGEASGFILGHFTNCQPKSERGYLCNDILKRYFVELNKPCVCGFPAGHEMPNHTIVFGREAEINAEQVWFH